MNVSVLTPMVEGSIPEEMYNGVKIKRIPIPGGNKIVKDFFWTLFASLIIAINNKKIDIIQIHGPTMFTFIILFFSRLLGKKTVVKTTLLDSDDPVNMRNLKIGFLSFMTFKWLDICVSISTPLVERYKQSGLDLARSRMIPQGVDTGRYRPLQDDMLVKSQRKKLNLPMDSIYLCFVGSIVKRKGVDIIRDAFLNLSKDFRQVHLLLVGRDDFPPDTHYAHFIEETKQILYQAHLEDRVHFIGHTDHPELYLQVSDIFVFPSRKEGFGSVIIEAMASGLPVIVSHLDGISSDIIDNGESGVIVNNVCSKEFEKEISHLIKNRKAGNQLGKKARKRAVSEFDFGTITKKYLNIYRSLIKRDSCC